MSETKIKFKVSEATSSDFIDVSQDSLMVIYVCVCIHVITFALAEVPTLRRYIIGWSEKSLPRFCLPAT